MFNFTPLLGALSNSPASQSLLEFEGGVKVLVDVGWDIDFDPSKLKNLERHIPTLSIILLTHATTSHLAAFAHCCKHFPLFKQIPIYATNPVISLGRTLTQDIYSSTPLASSIIPNGDILDTPYAYSNLKTEGNPQILLQPPTPEEIASYFALINPLKYSQSHQPLPSPFSPPLNGLTITAYNAGHTLGGTIWHIQHGMESVVYAVDWNQVRENVLSGAAWLGNSGTGGAEVIEQLRKPTALVCSSKGIERTTLAGGKTKRDELLLDQIRSVVSKGGTVLIPTDSSARVLELAYILDHAWRKEENNKGESDLKSTKLYLASKNIGATLRYARSMLEWMDENVVRVFEAEVIAAGKQEHQRKDSKQKRNNEDTSNQNLQATEDLGGPFNFKYLRLLERKSQIEKVLSKNNPKVILACDSSLTWGFSVDVLHGIASHPSNLVILTEEYEFQTHTSINGKQSLGCTLWDWYLKKKDGIATETGSSSQIVEQVYTDGRDLQFLEQSRTLLEGKELAIYQRFLATQRQFQNTLQSGSGAALENSADVIDETSSTSSSSSDESDPEHQGKALNISTTLALANRQKSGGSKEVIGVNVLLQQPGLYDYDVRGKKGRETMFPFATRRRRADDFGELIRPEDYLRAEERDEVDGQDMRNADGTKIDGLGQKRKWVDSARSVKGGQSSSAVNKRRRLGQSSAVAGTLNSANSANYTNGNENDEDGFSEDSDGDMEELPIGPSKLTYTSSIVQTNLRIAYVDFAGLYDQRTFSNLIPLIQPRKVILIGGSPSETAWLSTECKDKLRSRSGLADEGVLVDVLAPAVNETVSASMDTNAWTVKLSEALVRRLHWQNVKGLGVVTLMGRLATTQPNDQQQAEMLRRKRQKVVKGETSDAHAEGTPTSEKDKERDILLPTLDVLPPNMLNTTRSFAQPLHVGDLRLADLRKILQASGHSAEFRGEGTLLIDEIVAVRKSATGQIEIESGGLRLPEVLIREQQAEALHAVKRRIYEGLAIIAGG